MSVSMLKICSWNVNGIHTPVKRKSILTLLKKENVDIALLQETHLDDKEHLKLQQLGFSHVFFSSFTSRSRGVAILLKKSLPFRLINCIKDKNGRYVIVKGLLQDEEIAIMNVYFPPGHQCDFLTNAFVKLLEFKVTRSIVGGDFNCQLNPLMDKLPSGLTPSFQAKFINSLCEDLDFVDVWRAQHPADKEFTFYSKQHCCHTRIDFFFVPKGLLQFIDYSAIGKIIISDHAPVFLHLKLQSPFNQTRYWRFNPFILKDSKFCSYFMSEFQSFFAINSPSTEDKSLLWETIKAFSRGLVISYTSSKRRRQIEQKNILDTKLKRAESDYVQNPKSAKLKEITALRSALESLHISSAERKVRFAKQRLYEHGDKPGKYLAYLTKKKADSQMISSIKDDQGHSSSDVTIINNTFVNFFKTLYKAESPCNSLSLMDVFFSKIELPSILEDQKLALNGPILKEEVLSAIGSLHTGKAPGPDGLSSEFYSEFQDVLVDPLLEMFNYSLENGILPPSLREANISLILKKGKQPEDCASYRPISLLNCDFKILSKILAKRLEDLLPQLIKEDQTGFIKGRNSGNSIRRLLNIIQFSHEQKMDSLVVSMDAEKAFDRVEWPYLFYTLSKFGLGEKFVSWVKLLYTGPLAAVITNGLRSSSFGISRGTRQGCPLSPLLFALVIEPLAEAIRSNPGIHGLAIASRQHKINLFADDVLVFLSKPDISIINLISVIKDFSVFSGYKINFSKSEAMPLGNLQTVPSGSLSFPFKWSTMGFVYLGIHITPKFDQMFKSNFTPLFNRIKLDLERWNTLPISWLGRIALLKMNVLPRLLYPIQMIPVLFLQKTLKDIDRWFSSFIWANKRPRLRINILRLPEDMGGLGLPDIRRYQLAAHLRYITTWISEDPTSLWLDIESFQSQVPLQNLLFIKKMKTVRVACTNPITVNSVKAWQSFRRFEGKSCLTSLYTPICNNLDFPPGISDSRFRQWALKGLSKLKDLFDNNILMSFSQISQKYNLDGLDFFRYLQIRNYIQKDTTLLSNVCSSEIEKQLFEMHSIKSIRLFYDVLSEYLDTSTHFLKIIWEKEFNIQVTEEDWCTVWENAKSLSICNKVRAIQLKILHRAHISPSQRSRFRADCSPFCPKCKTEIGSLTHCLWFCNKIQRFWWGVSEELNKILGVTLVPDPRTYLLGVSPPVGLDKCKIRLFNILIFSAKKCILLKWISDKAPSIRMWHQTILEYLSLDYLTCIVHDKTGKFHKIWEPFMTYVEFDIASILTRGFI